MPKEFAFAPKLKLIADHLKAVRTLYKYVNGVELKKDLQDLSNYLQQDLSRSVFRPAGVEGTRREGRRSVFQSEIFQPQVFRL
ncbi:MAG: hypothetical protein NTY38_32355 [Acidobacteria bacterium]|nr:hypothetical protein [Acidobacteriota bacterium]